MMKDVFMINSLEIVKVLSVPLRVQILWELLDQAKTGKMLADQFEMPAAKIHYHLQELLKIDIITIERTEEKNGIVQKFYRLAAKNLYLDPALFEQHSSDKALIDSLRANLLESLRRTQRIALSLKHETLQNPNNWLQCCLDVRLTEEQYRQVQLKLQAFVDELKSFANQDAGTPYHFQIAGLPMELEGNS